MNRWTAMIKQLMKKYSSKQLIPVKVVSRESLYWEQKYNRKKSNIQY